MNSWALLNSTPATTSCDSATWISVLSTVAGSSPGSLRRVRGSTNRLNSPLNPTCRGSCRSEMSTIIPVEPRRHPPPPTPPPPRASRAEGGEKDWRAILSSHRCSVRRDCQPSCSITSNLYRHNFQKPARASGRRPKGSSRRGVQTPVSTSQDRAPTGQHRDSVAGNERVVPAVHSGKRKRRPSRGLCRSARRATAAFVQAPGLLRQMHPDVRRFCSGS